MDLHTLTYWVICAPNECQGIFLGPYETKEIAQQTANIQSCGHSHVIITATVGKVIQFMIDNGYNINITAKKSSLPRTNDNKRVKPDFMASLAGIKDRDRVSIYAEKFFVLAKSMQAQYAQPQLLLW